MKILEKILYVVCLCSILICVMVLVPLTRQINSDYDVTLYYLDSNEPIQSMTTHVFGTYEYYLFHINSNCKFNGSIEISYENNDNTHVYENVFISTHKDIGAIYYLDNNSLESIGFITDIINPTKTGKIILSQPYSNCYAIYEKQ